MLGATSVTSTSFFSSVTAAEGSVSKGHSLVSAGKPPLSGHKRKPCAGAHSEANTMGSRCHCSKRSSWPVDSFFDGDTIHVKRRHDKSSGEVVMCLCIFKHMLPTLAEF
ncbi:WRKY68-b transcription factor [Hordeum vulgare]|nr:WRKY68-b transcription factor [Hordeum vulgare]